MSVILFLFFISFFLSRVLYQPSLTISGLLGAIDKPNERKIHSVPTARAGGLIMYLPFAFILITAPIGISLKIPLVLGCSTIFFLGLLDDTVSISPHIKLMGQFFALSIYHFTSEYFNSDFSSLWGVIVALWIIFITNATNIIDGLDGLAGGVCASETLCLLSLAIIYESSDVFICLTLLLGAIIGFLPRNFPQSTIFMGDCGALFLGFTLAILSSILVTQSKSIVCLLSVLLIFRVPIYDTNVSILRRLFKHQSPFKADKEHFHHLLLKYGFTHECAALALITISLFFGFLGVIICIL